MATVTLKGSPFQTLGELPSVGSKAPEFSLTASDLSLKTLEDFKGNKLVLNIFPSIDTGICAASVRAFNKEAGNLENTKVVCISRDLPFALGRFCGAEGLDNVITLSDYKYGDFGNNYGLIFTNGPLDALLSRSIVVLDENGNVVYTEQVSETTEEPNYKNALAAL
jgi:thiol peroxidase